jgi:hypothetical protein
MYQKLNLAQTYSNPLRELKQSWEAVVLYGRF